MLLTDQFFEVVRAHADRQRCVRRRDLAPAPVLGFEQLFFHFKLSMREAGAVSAKDTRARFGWGSANGQWWRQVCKHT
jgi:hypothetical protein